MGSPEVLRNILDGPVLGRVSWVALGRAPQTAQSRREEGTSIFEYRACVGVAEFRTKVVRLGKGERDTTDDSLGYDFEFPHPGGRATVEGEAPPPLDPPRFPRH